jgi:hypothetical protein
VLRRMVAGRIAGLRWRSFAEDEELDESTEEKDDRQLANQESLGERETAVERFSNGRRDLVDDCIYED